MSNKILSDDEKHKEAQTTQMEDEQEPEGSMPATGSDETTESTLEEAQEMGLYEKTSDDDGEPEEVDVETQEFKDELKRLQQD